MKDQIVTIGFPTEKPWWQGMGAEAGTRLANDLIRSRRTLTPAAKAEYLDRSALRLCNALLARGVSEANIERQLDAMEAAFHSRLKAWATDGGRA